MNQIETAQPTTTKGPEPEREPQTKMQRFAELRAYTQGSVDRYSIPMSKMRYTGGVAAFAEIFGAYWLTTLIASHQEQVQRSLYALGERDFQVWDIRTSPTGESAWSITAWTDTPYGTDSRMLALQLVPFSDLPRELSLTKLYAIDGTIMLPEEY
jgi:hypothetical protein